MTTHIIRRRSQKSFNEEEALQKVLEELRIDFPKFKCPIAIYGNIVNLHTCVIRCSFPCRVFNNFEYVVAGCDDESCDDHMPCIDCSIKIDKYKTLINCIRAIYDSGNASKRYKPGRIQLNARCLNRDVELQQAGRTRIREVELNDED